MTVEELLDQFDDLIEDAFTLPFSSKKVVDASKARDIIDDLRLNIPQEFRQAKAIVADRSEIISNARREAEGIIRDAEAKAKGLIAREESLRNAQAKSVDIINQAHLKSREIKKAAAEYADETMKRTDEILQQSITAQREIYKHIDESVSQVLA